MSWLEDIFADDPEPRVARDRLIDRVTRDPLFEAHRKKVKRGFIEPRLEFPAVTSAEDVLGERLGMVLRLLAGGDVEDPRGVLATEENRVLVSANMLKAVPVLWPGAELELATSVDLPETTVTANLLPAPMMWWTFQHSVNLSSPNSADIELDGLFIQRESPAIGWFSLGARNQRFYIEPGALLLGRTYPSGPGRRAPLALSGLAYLARTDVVMKPLTGQAGGSADAQDLVQIVGRLGNLRSSGPGH